ncbi:MAG: hypothetical protein IJW41_04035 [Oscillospiraceae bacterium]|nr:hypothetical protein [Oscillospiraceae bacterium]
MKKTKTEKIRSGIEKYRLLRQQLFETDVSTDRDFQRTYNGFWRMGRRTEAYYSDYYCYLQQHKNTGVLFADALTYLYEKHGRLEMSFVSKMVAMVDPQYPIWDSVVTKGHFGIIAPFANVKNRLQKGIERYEQYRRCYGTYMQTEEAAQKIAEFESLFPDAEISNVKKLDFMLWQER